MSPAGQSLHTGDGSALEGNDRLVEDLELLPLDRPPQLALEREPAHGPRAHLFVEELEPVAPPFFGPVEGGVGVAQHGVGRRLAVGPRQHDPDADRHVHVLPFDLERAAHASLDPRRHRDRFLGRREILATHRELVAAEPGARVPGSDRVPQEIVAETMALARNAARPGTAEAVPVSTQFTGTELSGSSGHMHPVGWAACRAIDPSGSM